METIQLDSKITRTEFFLSEILKGIICKSFINSSLTFGIALTKHLALTSFIGMDSE
ncbi:MAG: hypothetical protein HQK79_20190 [Desulfobacterales bacterium]|nr:hypothetical protein [Desulfobacterales bacterium]